MSWQPQAQIHGPPQPGWVWQQQPVAVPYGCMPSHGHPHPQQPPPQRWACVQPQPGHPQQQHPPQQLGWWPRPQLPLVQPHQQLQMPWQPQYAQHGMVQWQPQPRLGAQLAQAHVLQQQPLQPQACVLQPQPQLAQVQLQAAHGGQAAECTAAISTFASFARQQRIAPGPVRSARQSPARAAGRSARPSSRNSAPAAAASSAARSVGASSGSKAGAGDGPPWRDSASGAGAADAGARHPHRPTAAAIAAAGVLSALNGGALQPRPEASSGAARGADSDADEGGSASPSSDDDTAQAARRLDAGRAAGGGNDALAALADAADSERIARMSSNAGCQFAQWLVQQRDAAA